MKFDAGALQIGRDLRAVNWADLPRHIENAAPR
jgi:hypothetical protein